jgi:hypothetical protein
MAVHGEKRNSSSAQEPPQVPHWRSAVAEQSEIWYWLFRMSHDVHVWHTRLVAVVQACVSNSSLAQVVQGEQTRSLTLVQGAVS